MSHSLFCVTCFTKCSLAVPVLTHKSRTERIRISTESSFFSPSCGALLLTCHSFFCAFVSTSKSQLGKFGRGSIQTNSHNLSSVGFCVVSTCDVAFLVKNSKNDRDANGHPDLTLLQYLADRGYEGDDVDRVVSDVTNNIVRIVEDCAVMLLLKIVCNF
jgi:hypothetical protein